MLIADLHIHSKYSLATSKDCEPETLDLWARRKGIGLVGTGDFTHPAWRAELREKLVPAEGGLYRLRPGVGIGDPAASGEAPRFVVTGEISTIYKKNGRTRKVHSLILLPGLEAAEELAHRLEAIGNIHSDGRPILGLDCRDLLEITLEACPEAIFIPAHIWTPHFSLLGAFSAFGSIGECFEDLTPHIHALETGLSSDPPMNWRLSALDGYHLISNSDAHSPAKLGREANLLDIEMGYEGLRGALEEGRGLMGTLEFFPEEGKYHMDGHRACGRCMTPAETTRAGGRCPVCGRKVTVGVMHRVEELADREEGYVRPGAPGFQSLVPLEEVIAASDGVAAAGVKARAKYERMLRSLGPEFTILRETPLEDIGAVAGPCVREGIRRLRAGEVERSPGFDGEYGKIGLISPGEREALNGQVSLFGEPPAKRRAAAKKAAPRSASGRAAARQAPEALSLNGEQRAAVTAEERAVAVTAGPGTGKTRTLVERILWLVKERGIRPGEITAVTFTNRAAEELRGRLEAALGKRAAKGVTVGTFHAVSLALLGEVRLLGEARALALAGETLRALDEKVPAAVLLREVSRRKNGLPPLEELDPALLDGYAGRLRESGLLDFDDLLLEALRQAETAKTPDKRFRHLLVDEFQDSNALQYRLIRAWNREGSGLFVIGDPDQAIYGFRGARTGCFERLGEDFPGLRRIRLVQNYRSTPEILRCALPVIDQNPGPARKLHSCRESGAPVRLITAPSELAEAVFVAKEIGRMVGGVDMLGSDRQGPGRRERAWSFSEIAVLYRTHRQADLLEKCLRRDGIPCVVTGRDDFLSDPRVLEAVGFFSRMLGGELLPGEEKFAAHFLPGVRGEKPRILLGEWAERTGNTGSEAVERLLHTSVFHRDMASLLNTLLLGAEGDVRRSAADYQAGAVSLMTLHGAKGLEFPAVFLCGARRGLIPLESQRRPADPEEERRLFYVGMTRAKDELVLLTSKEPSPFLDEIPKERLEAGTAGRPRPEAVQMSLF